MVFPWGEWLHSDGLLVVENEIMNLVPVVDTRTVQVSVIRLVVDRHVSTMLTNAGDVVWSVVKEKVHSDSGLLGDSAEVMERDIIVIEPAHGVTDGLGVSAVTEQAVSHDTDTDSFINQLVKNLGSIGHDRKR